MNWIDRLLGILLFLFLSACNLPAASTPPPDLLATLAASTPLVVDSPPTPYPTSSNGEPTGKIAFTCQVFKVQASNQICIINADGTGFRRLTTDNTRQHYYPSVAPDGRSVVYAAFRGETLEQFMATRKVAMHYSVAGKGRVEALDKPA